MMRQNLSISIIIPTYNEATIINRCLKSIGSQRNIEIIVADNYSTDKTVKIASRYTSLIYTKGKERSAQRNFGAKRAKGDYLLFLDADMQLTKNIFVEALRLVASPRNIVAFPEKSLGKSFWEKAIALERNLYHHEMLISAARFFPKKLFQKLGGFDEKLVAGEDWDLTIRAIRNGSQLVHTKGSIIHQERVINLKDYLNKKRYYIKNISLFSKKHPGEYKQLSSFQYRLGIYLKNWQRLIFDPLHTIGFLFLKTLVWFNLHLVKRSNDQKSKRTI